MKRNHSAPLTLAISVGLILSACGGGDSTGLADPIETQAPDTVAEASQDVPPVATPTPTSAPAAAPVPTSAPQPVPVLGLRGAAVITQLTDTDAGGARPLLEWEAVQGASNYYVVVYTELGDPYWAATTSETAVFVGGPVQIPDDRDGPRVGPGYSWAVYADGPDDAPIASSPLRSVSP